MRPLLIAYIVPMLMISTPSVAAAPWSGVEPLSPQALAEISGGAAPTTRLSRFSSELAVGQGQLVSENLRTSLEIWFADNNVQLAANAAILR